jgi:F-type H+-transporting ATPase subunit b
MSIFLPVCGLKRAALQDQFRQILTANFGSDSFRGVPLTICFPGRRTHNIDMEQTLRQLGELLLGAIPTGVLLLMLYGMYHVIVHKPLEAVLAKRRELTQGAVEQARADVAAAAARASEYETRLREARLAVFKTLDSRRKQAIEARASAVAQARERSQQQIAAAKAQLDQETATARATLDASSDSIANQIIQTVLRTVGSNPTSSLGGR